MNGVVDVKRVSYMSRVTNNGRRDMTGFLFGVLVSTGETVVWTGRAGDAWTSLVPREGLPCGKAHAERFMERYNQFTGLNGVRWTEWKEAAQ